MYFLMLLKAICTGSRLFMHWMQRWNRVSNLGPGRVTGQSSDFDPGWPY